MSTGAWHQWRVATISVAMAAATAVTVAIVHARWNVPASPAVDNVSGTAPVPTPAAVEACNRQAAGQSGTRTIALDRASRAPGATVPAATPFGLDQRRKDDARYRDAYAACMRAWGFGG